MKLIELFTFSLLLISKVGFACDVTISAGHNLISAATSTAAIGDEICLNAGTYSQDYTIYRKQGQTLRGLGTAIADTEIFTSASPIIDLGSNSVIRNFRISGVPLVYTPYYAYPEYGVLAWADTDVTIWSVELDYVENPINIVNGSDGASIWDTYVTHPGVDDGAPNPSIWIDDSDYVTVLYGAIVGRSNGVGGDGEIACRNSNYMNVDGTYVSSSGAAGMYFVNCDNATVENATIVSGDEWGLDVVDGSGNFTATGNTINSNFWGAVVFDEADNGSGTFTGNSFTGNNTSGSVNCQGIVVIGNVGNVSQSGNTASPGPVICSL